jgi:hypothetical protein
MPARIVTDSPGWNTLLLAAAALTLLVVTSGCAPVRYTRARPIVPASAIATTSETNPSTPDTAADLTFFIALGSQPLISHDDALHAALLLGHGSSATSYPDRLSLASRLGYLDPSFTRPPLEAATVGEVARLLVHIADGPDAGRGLSQDRAVSRLVTRGWLPAQAKSHQGLTGPQLLTLIRSAREGARTARPTSPSTAPSWSPGLPLRKPPASER